MVAPAGTEPLAQFAVDSFVAAESEVSWQYPAGQDPFGAYHHRMLF